MATGTGHHAAALGITEEIEPAPNMRALAIQRGINVRNATAEVLPYHDLSFDYVVMSICISYFDNLHLAFREANRVLKREGTLIVGFIDKNSTIGKYYEQRRQKSIFYKQAIFYTQKVAEVLEKVGFKRPRYSQTLFNELDAIKTVEPAEPGYGKGSFVIINAIRR